MKIGKGDTVKFQCPWGEKSGIIVSIEDNNIGIQTNISLWIVTKDKIIENLGKK